ncbi:hypothetical protein [Coraliomargarita sinensis]|nr:hypothetical protein [Coraliomargarita sinensis]
MNPCVYEGKHSTMGHHSTSLDYIQSELVNPMFAARLSTTT